MNDRFKAVLFDLDGTLLDTLDDLADSMNAVLTGLDCPVHPVAAYKYFVGTGLENLVRKVLPANRQDTKSIEYCTKGMLSEYRMRWQAKTALYPGIADMLDLLTGKDIVLTILSNKPHDFTLQTVGHFLSKWQFRIVSGARPDVPKKPDPAGAIHISQTLAVDPQQVLYLGDTNTDMETAVRAGMYPVGVLWGFRGAEELQQAGAKCLLKHPLDIKELFYSC